MSEHYFAASLTPCPTRIARKRDRIAREVGGPRCGYTSVDVPGTRGSWGYCPNRGEPFDRAMAREISEAWEAAGVGLQPTPREVERAWEQRA